MQLMDRAKPGAKIAQRAGEFLNIDVCFSHFSPHFPIGC